MRRGGLFALEDVQPFVWPPSSAVRCCDLQGFDRSQPTATAPQPDVFRARDTSPVNFTLMSAGMRGFWGISVSLPLLSKVRCLMVWRFVN